MKRESESELRVYSWGALFDYVRQCHDMIDRVQKACGQHQASLSACRKLARGVILPQDEIDALDSCAVSEVQLAIQRDRGKVTRTDNGDGTESWRGLTTTVSTGLVPEGETPIGLVPILSIEDGVRFINNLGKVVVARGGSQNLLRGDIRIVLAPKPEPPQFRVGGIYKMTCGTAVRLEPATEPRGEFDMVGRLLGDDESKIAWAHYNSEGVTSNYTERHRLLPGEVEPLPSWVPPVSLADSEVSWSADLGWKIKVGSTTRWSLVPYYKDWTDPPKPGKWLVKAGVATWTGE